MIYCFPYALLKNITYLGEIEATFMQAAARHANLSAILADDAEIRQTIVDTVATMDATAREDMRGFRLASILDPSQADFNVDSKARPLQLNKQEHKLFLDCIQRVVPHASYVVSPTVLAVDEISIRGVCFGTSTSSKSRNSAIMFRSHDGGELRPGIIKTIFQPTHHPMSQLSTRYQGFHLIVQEHTRMRTFHDNKVDPYLEFGFSAGFLCEKDSIKMHVLEPSQIMSHFVLTKFVDKRYEDYIHALPVDRASVPSL